MQNVIPNSPYLTPSYVSIIILLLLLLSHIIIRINYNIKFQRAGGTYCKKLANNQLTAFSWLYTVGIAQTRDRMIEFFDYALSRADPENGGQIVEINVTGGQRYFFTREPEHIKTVLTGKFAEFGKGEEFHRVWVCFLYISLSIKKDKRLELTMTKEKPFLGDSIFTTDAKQWQDSRNLIRPMFIKNRVSDLHIFERWTQVMMNQFPASGQTFDIQNLFYRMTIDVITDFLLGESVNSLETPRNEFVKAFTDVQRMQTMLTILM
jgi:cytochrome P450